MGHIIGIDLIEIVLGIKGNGDIVVAQKVKNILDILQSHIFIADAREIDGSITVDFGMGGVVIPLYHITADVCKIKVGGSGRDRSCIGRTGGITIILGLHILALTNYIAISIAKTISYKATIITV